MTACAIPVAARLIAIGIAVRGFVAILNDLRADLLQRFAPDGLILLELLALASAAVRHRILPLRREQIPSPKSLRRAFPVHDDGIEGLALTEVDEVVWRHPRRVELGQILQPLGGNSRRNATVERAEVFR